jgi:hypothetical protein
LIVVVVFAGVPTTEKVHEVVTSVPPTNTLKVPPDPVKDDTVPELSAETVCAPLVKNPIIASEPS